MPRGAGENRQVGGPPDIHGLDPRRAGIVPDQVVGDILVTGLHVERRLHGPLGKVGGHKAEVRGVDEVSGLDRVEIEPRPLVEPERRALATRGMIRDHDLGGSGVLGPREQAGGFRVDYRLDARARRIAAQDPEDVLARVAFCQKAAVGLHLFRIGRWTATGVLRPEGEDGHVQPPLGGLVDDAVDVLEIRPVNVAWVAGDERELPIRVGAIAVVPNGDAALDDREAFGLAVVEVKIDVCGRGVVEYAPGGVAEPEERRAVGPYEVMAVLRDTNGRQRLNHRRWRGSGRRGQCSAHRGQRAGCRNQEECNGTETWMRVHEC